MDWTALARYMPLLVEGFQVTLFLTAVGTATSLVMAGVLLAVSRSGYRVLGIAVRIYTEIILGLPILVLLYVIYFVFPEIGVTLDATTCGLVTLTLYYSPYMAEAMRGAVAAVPSGQIEAARAIGMSGPAIAGRIVVPQAVGLMIPPLTGLMIGLAKDTAILSVISVQEFAYRTKQVVSRTYAPFEVWLFAALVYWICLSNLEVMMRFIERRTTRYRAS